MRGLLIRTLRSRYPKRLKELLELAGTELQKFKMRPEWGAKTLFSRQVDADACSNAPVVYKRRTWRPLLWRNDVYFLTMSGRRELFLGRRTSIREFFPSRGSSVN
jgi:hypothetical protein